jgi:MiaB-like tRNA modifying enzyme
MLEIYFESHGCSASHNNTEIMKGLVMQAGLNITSNLDYADFIVINSCIVKEATEEKIRRRVFDLLGAGKKIILAGCMPRMIKKKLQKRNLFLLDVSQIKNIVNVIRDATKNNYRDKYIEKKKEIKLDSPKVLRDKVIGITQISEGCLGICSYCAVRLVKGNLFSYPIEKIIKSVKKDISFKCREIWITSQDNASYGNDEGEYNLPDLLKDILNLKGNFFLRLGMMNPNNVLKILPQLIEIYKHKKMFKFLHLPLQSGSDKILKSMNRQYKVNDFLKIINEFKSKFPNITISTDVIVGYPNESDGDFKKTYELIKKIKPEILNISKFCKRENTSASKLKLISPEVMKKRIVALSKLHLNICNEDKKKWINKEEKVLIDKKGFKNTYLARSDSYKLFAVYSKKNILGKFVKVKVKKLTPHYLISEVI